jgi:hypothetical protein
LSSLIKNWLDENAEYLGVSRISPLISDDLADLMKIDFTSPEWNWLNGFMFGLDALHNCKGHLGRITKRLLTWRNFDKKIFIAKLEQFVKKRF